MEEAKEFIITADSSAEIREEAVKSLITMGIDGLQFNAVATMALTDDEESQTIRTFVVNGNTVTVTQDAYLTFVDDYFRIKAEEEERYLQQIIADSQAATIEMKEQWERNGLEWPLNN